MEAEPRPIDHLEKWRAYVSAPWKRRALARCDDVDSALAALIVDLRAYDRAAALAAREQLSYALFHRRFESPAEVREWILSFPDGGLCACHENRPGDIARAA